MGLGPSLPPAELARQDSVNFQKCSSLFLVHRTLASGAPDAGFGSIGRWPCVRWIRHVATSLEPSIGCSGIVAPNAEVALFMRPVATWRQQLLRTLVCTRRSGVRWPTVRRVRWAKIISSCLLECIGQLALDSECWASDVSGARWNDRWTLNVRDTWRDLVHRTLLVRLMPVRRSVQCPRFWPNGSIRKGISIYTCLAG
jgi:hypothetical protein